MNRPRPKIKNAMMLPKMMNVKNGCRATIFCGVTGDVSSELLQQLSSETCHQSHDAVLKLLWVKKRSALVASDAAH